MILNVTLHSNIDYKPGHLLNITETLGINNFIAKIHINVKIKSSVCTSLTM